eukprot:gnl/TRDRNA2_/TRDRNA2_148446_c0_seq1.p1 gnl/TRDRNA2_/TRDRNA2_148446_c0~~gnl/TRDRNA2_/TRDRNA2_148446_c0_seq1.p1  ORF type:complete len:366 (-),score=49.81 gnl/TRDRNA2_/TRDRNA2_148446_c0_seq1:79-1071(-)
MWDYRIDGAVWNFMPSTPGDGSLIFSTHCARAHRLNLTTGQLIWKAKSTEPQTFCGTGGGALGPNGIFYVAANNFDTEGVSFEGLKPCNPLNPYVGCMEGPGVLIGYRVSDGEVVLKRRMPGMGNQYPAVGMVKYGSSSRLAVVAGVGNNPALPFKFWEDMLPRWIPGRIQRIVGDTLFMLQLRSRLVRRALGIPVITGRVYAFDAEAGNVLWTYSDESWDHYACAGDEDRYFERLARHQANPTKQEFICGPDSWAIPLISGDGTVYAGSGTGGNLYAIRDDDGNGVIEESEVSTFKPGQAFLNAPALAPGMLAVAPCWGPMYVFKDGKK